MKRTNIPTDMAIQGEGFFVVRKDDENYLTRAGNFSLTAQGELVTQQGYNVLNEAGSPIVIDPFNGPWQVTASGTIRQRGTSQNLAVVRPASTGDLVKAGENLFRPLADAQPIPLSERRVADGYLELSDVKPTTEMIEMITAARTVEANIKMMQTQDQMTSGLISRVMRVR